MELQVKDLLKAVVDHGASDLHLKVGVPPTLRINGRLMHVEGWPVLTAEMTENMIMSLLNQEQRVLLVNDRELDFSYQFSDVSRFRINSHYQQNTLAAALRLVPSEIRSFEQLRLPGSIAQFAKWRQGLVLVTGPTGHGKSTTLAALIDDINENRSEHILTIEDPIEFVYTPKRSIISQRELHSDTKSWEVALRSALREDPDVVLVGEMRDFETIAAALTVAETGHLVFATLHTNSAAQTIDRIIDVFPEHQQAQIRMQLSSVIRAVVAQRLIPSNSGSRVPATEILLASGAVSNVIREGKTHQIDNIIQTSYELGMMSLDYSLAKLVDSGDVNLEVAESYSIRPDELHRLVKRAGGK